MPTASFLETRTPDIRARMGTEYGAVRKAVAAGISAGYENSISSQWSVWLGFCARIGLDPHFETVTDPIPFLQIFAHRVRTGDIATHGKKSENARWNSISAPWDRATPSWGPANPVITSTAESTSAYIANYAATQEKTRLQRESNRSQHQSFNTYTTDVSQGMTASNASQTSSGSHSTSLCSPASIATQETTTHPRH